MPCQRLDAHASHQPGEDSHAVNEHSCAGPRVQRGAADEGEGTGEPPDRALALPLLCSIQPIAEPLCASISFFIFFFETEFRSCYPGWSAMA